MFTNAPSLGLGADDVIEFSDRAALSSGREKIRTADVVTILAGVEEIAGIAGSLKDTPPDENPPKGILLISGKRLENYRPFANRVGIVTGDVSSLPSLLVQVKGDVADGKRLPASSFTQNILVWLERALEPTQRQPTKPESPGKPPGNDKPPSHDDDGEAARVVDFDLRKEEFSQYAWDLLQVARRLGKSRPRPDVVSTRRLTAALLLSGLEEWATSLTGGWLIQQLGVNGNVIRQRLATLYSELEGGVMTFPRLIRDDERPSSRLMTTRLKVAVDLARRLATEAQAGQNRGTIGARHLLAAIVARASDSPEGVSLLKHFGPPVDELRARLLVHLPHWGVADDVEVWRRLIDPAPATGADNRHVPAYAGDGTDGDDLIGITREVEAMASLVCAWSIEPPLSIGLFGEWGSGKSFFVKKMKERVWQIAAEARKSSVGQREFGYYKNIVQIEFNAWHYVEGNLWASLVEHIFTNLRLSGVGSDDVDSEEYIRKRQEKLLGEIREKSTEMERKAEQAAELTRKAEEEKARAESDATRLQAEAIAAQELATKAEAERRAAEARAREAERQRDTAVQERWSMAAQDVIESIKNSSDIRTAVEKDLGLLGITPERIQSVQGLRDALKEASDAGKMMGESLRIVATAPNRGALLLTTFGLAVAGAAVVGFGAWWTEQQGLTWVQSIKGVVSTAGGLVTAAVAAWKLYSPKLKPILDAGARLKAKHAEMEQRVEAARKEREDRAVTLDATVQTKSAEAARHAEDAAEKLAEADQAKQRAKEKEEAAAQATCAVKKAQTEIQRLQKEADELRPDRRIAAFIQDRAGARDYRRHLGVAALIRRDFEKLSAMFESQRKAEEKDADGRGATATDRNDPSIVNRIILYIDDLDRCPPEKVVEVLRAIHLLLAFPLFVVVVAVDARWMKRSLQERFFSLLRPSENGANGKHQDAAPEPMRMPDALATPDDYLEKIFQVPFWIQPLNPKAAKNLIAGLIQHEDPADRGQGAGNGDPAQPAGTPAAGQAPGVSSGAGGAGGTATMPQPNPGTAPGGPAPLGTAPVSGPSTSDTQGQTFKWSAVEARPGRLKLSKDERLYMEELAPLVGRSPRSLKRFINCYRLLKSTRPQGEITQVAQDGTFRATMLVLGMTTGLPELAPLLFASLRKTENTKSPQAWARQAAKEQNGSAQKQWETLFPLFEQLVEKHKITTLRPFHRAADLVDRFSFSPVRERS